jgi:hypothetical protein
LIGSFHERQTDRQEGGMKEEEEEEEKKKHT